jgi:tetratricopeptide (TPR) repeat protein
MKNRLVVLFLLLSASMHCQLIKEYNECAVESLDKGDINAAINYFTQVITINPLDSFAYLDRGMAYERCSRYCDAIADFSRAIQIDSTNVDHYFLRAIVYDKIGNDDLALKDYDKTIETEPDNSDAHYYKGRISIRQGNYSRSLQELDLAIKFISDNAKAYSSRGWAKMQLGDTVGAVKDLDTAIAIDSSCLEAYYYRAWMLSEMLLFEKAQRDYLKIMQLNPDNEYFQTPTITHKSKTYAIALASYVKENQEVYYSAGLLGIYFQDYKTAIGYLSAEIVRQPLNAGLHYFKGYAFSKTGDSLNALGCYNRAISLDPEKAAYYYARGTLLDRLGEKEKAASDFLKCVTLGGLCNPAACINCK